MRARVESAFAGLDPSGAVAAECWRDYEQKLNRWHAASTALETLDERLAAVDAELDAILAPANRLVDALHRSGAATSPADLGIEPERLTWAVANCHLMRNRFTIADLAFFIGIYEPDDVAQLIADTESICGSV
jgi:glycerol-1-phosphate dehydrogenase [NAD(P)+]